MQRTLFEVCYFVGFVAASAVRARYARRPGTDAPMDEHTPGLDIALMYLQIVGMLVLPVVYVSSSWLDFADYELPAWSGLVGVGLFAAAVWLLWRTHVDLGRNWSPNLNIVAEHTLVTEGVYRLVRHPMYTAHLLWGLAQPFLLHNWLAGLGMLACMAPLLWVRVPKEERMLREHFGEEYEDYMGRTGRFVPPLRRSPDRLADN